MFTGLICQICNEPLDANKQPGDKPIRRTTKWIKSVKRERRCLSCGAVYETKEVISRLAATGNKQVLATAQANAILSLESQATEPPSEKNNEPSPRIHRSPRGNDAA